VPTTECATNSRGGGCSRARGSTEDSSGDVVVVEHGFTVSLERFSELGSFSPTKTLHEVAVRHDENHNFANGSHSVPVFLFFVFLFVQCDVSLKRAEQVDIRWQAEKRMKGKRQFGVANRDVTADIVFAYVRDEGVGVIIASDQQYARIQSRQGIAAVRGGTYGYGERLSTLSAPTIAPGPTLNTSTHLSAAVGRPVLVAWRTLLPPLPPLPLLLSRPSQSLSIAS
jgi:hypothetical protein